MLRRSFVFLPGVGPKREQRIWRRGISDWDEYLDWARSPHREIHAPLIDRARRALEVGESGFFAHHLPRNEMWRTWNEFGAGALSLDIETNDEGITIVGVHGRSDAFGPADRGAHDRDVGSHRTRLFVRGSDLTPEAVSATLAQASILLSYNGAAFDLPALKAFGVRIPPVPHIDLVAPLHRAGLKGGLKAIERKAGIERPREVDGLSGYDAILLWRQHELGDAEALPRLLRYNACDVESLPALASLAYDSLSALVASEVPERRLDAFEVSNGAARHASDFVNPTLRGGVPAAPAGSSPGRL
ncbi:MAG: ribonuclease H-like domain-containing protein [Thermoplasmatota archaeon]